MKFNIDDLVVVTDLQDTIVYVIVSIKNDWAMLHYQSGYKIVTGGAMPLSCLKKPTKQQLINNGLD